MSIIAIIPARKGSKGLVNKNKKLLGGSPLFMHSLEYAINANIFSKIIVSTDDEEIMQTANSRGPYCNELRPDYLCQDTSKSSDVVLYHIAQLEKLGYVYDYVCLLQPTSPYRPIMETVDAIREFIASKGDTLVSLRSVPSHYNPEWLFEFYNDQYVKSLSNNGISSRRQDLKNYYHRDGAFYITKVSLLKETKSLLAGSLQPMLIQSKELINIDTIEDWNIAEKYF